jgi:type IV pilus assembly protein PilP
MTSHRSFCYVFLAVLLSGLGGCGDSGVPEIRQWMEEAKRNTKVTTPKLYEPKKFTPFLYPAKNEVDPFNPIKLSVALAKLQAKSNGGLKPDIDRRREALEAYPLDTIKMVGTLQKPGLNQVLLQVDKTVFQAKVGNYVGPNFGMITKVTETGVELKEIVQDASGEWTERKATLELQETKK